MSVFADASALVTLYVEERGRHELRDMPAIAISQLSRVEVTAALWRKQRSGELTESQAGNLVAAFEADYLGTGAEAPRFAAVAPTVDVLDEAARLTAAHGLRAYDAVQLATGIMTRRADPSCTTFALYDESLRQAAARESFTLLP